MKKKIFELGALGAAIVILSGCQGIDALGNAVYEGRSILVFQATLRRAPFRNSSKNDRSHD